MCEVLLWGIMGDRPLELVRAALTQRKAPCLFLDQQAVLQSRIALAMNGELRGSLRTVDWSVNFSSITAVFLRPYDVRRMATVEKRPPDSLALHQAVCFEDSLMCWMEMTSALVINRPSAMCSNNSKPYQLQLIRSVGFDVPETLVTTDPQAIVEFWERHGSLIYKSVSGVRSIVSRLGPEHMDRMDDVIHCPTQFQQYIKGTDFRVHIVGNQIFSCEILSTSDDYRYPKQQDTQPLVRSCAVPDDVGTLCRKLTAFMNLAIAGIDLRRTPPGDWYCFEVNPSPGFSFYEEATGQPISEAIASLLMAGR